MQSTQELINTKLQASLSECDIHLKRLTYAHANIAEFLPIAANQLDNLTEQQVAALDQYIYRFTKLQDTMGNRLFNDLLNYLAENSRNMAFIDKLNRLEQLEILPSSQEWLELRQLRNQLAHEYQDDQQKRAEVINLVFDQHSNLVTIFTRFKSYIERKLS